MRIKDIKDLINPLDENAEVRVIEPQIDYPFDKVELRIFSVYEENGDCVIELKI